MPIYLYTARDILTRHKIKGEVNLPNEQIVVHYLKSRKLYPLSISKKTIWNTDLGELSVFRRNISLKAITFFCKQFVSMIQAGIGIVKALEICTEKCTNQKLKKHLIVVCEEVTEGCLLSEALRKEKVFPCIMTEMVACGEMSGRLEEVFEELINHFEMQLAVQKKIKKALMYPVIVLITMNVVLAILMIKVVPSLMLLLIETDAKVPKATELVIAMSHLFVAYWKYFLIFLVILGVAERIFKETKSFKKCLGKLALSIPIIGKLNKKYMATLFSSTMAMMMEAGIPMLQAVAITKNIMGNEVTKEELGEVELQLKKGSSLYETMKKSKSYPEILYSMIYIGEEAGTLDEMLMKMKVYFKEEVEVTVERLIVLIEPTLTIIMALLVGGIMLAILEPTFSAATSIL